MRILTLAAALVLCAARLPAQQVSPAIYTDPPRDTAHPARMQVLHIPSGAVRINGVAYLAAGAGAHPTLVLAHGLPGNEKNLDLAQAVRRAGWNAVTFNYRGSWGSPGAFRFGQNLEDAAAVLAFLRDTANARALGIDTARLVLGGHSMGGWVTAHTAARDPGLRGAILISAADMGLAGSGPRERAVALAAGNMESLAGVTPEQMADELVANAAGWRFDAAAPGLAATPLLVLTSNDGLAPHSESLVRLVRARGNQQVTVVHADTDHGWSDRRIALQDAVIGWLQSLAP
ncbi:MAG TPA: alpha/beta hydrolase [Longimicrobium sp.]|jgi:pimeloyl-ACP methyl ester carboxylesterase|uniref:alpha/beta hydrolase family protein n=1 Tax=Longimicrobium sp. TaxID=2029185 RepID=UPI002ED9E05E